MTIDEIMISPLMNDPAFKQKAQKGISEIFNQISNLEKNQNFVTANFLKEQ